MHTRKWMRIHYWYMCVQISCFPGWPCCHRRRRTTNEVNLRWNRLLIASLLASSANYFLISWQKPSSHCCGTFPLIFQNFSWCQLLEEQKFSRENFHGLLKTAKIFSPWNFRHLRYFVFFATQFEYNMYIINNCS